MRADPIAIIVHVRLRKGAEAGAMLDACRLAGLSALETYYAEVKWRAQCGAAFGRAALRWR